MNSINLQHKIILELYSRIENTTEINKLSDKSTKELINVLNIITNHPEKTSELSDLVITPKKIVDIKLRVLWNTIIEEFDKIYSIKIDYNIASLKIIEISVKELPLSARSYYFAREILQMLEQKKIIQITFEFKKWFYKIVSDHIVENETKIT